MTKGKAPSDTEQYWKQRTLCSDENCIGVVGSDGRCRECGRMHEELAGRDEGTEPPPESDLQPLSEEASAAEEASEAQPDAEEDGPINDADTYWAERLLCIDENCIGVVGTDGRCKECGKKHPGHS